MFSPLLRLVDLGNIVITLMGTRELDALLLFGLWLALPE